MLAGEGKILQRRVSIGDWDYVGEYFRGLTEEESKAGYQAMLASLADELGFDLDAPWKKLGVKIQRQIMNGTDAELEFKFELEFEFQSVL